MLTEIHCKMEEAMSFRTLFFSRLLGLSYLIGGLAMLAHRNVSVGALATLPSNRLAVLGISSALVLAGLVMVLAHNRWSKPPLVFIVTLLGWLTLIKGVVYLLLPASCMAALLRAAIDCSAYWHFAAAFLLLLGAYLTYAGFRAKSV
jgi:hypothetical protein